MADRIDLVIFDCDGVLVDSEPIALDLLRRTLRDDGLDLPTGAVRDAFQGRSLASVPVIADERFGHRVDAARLERMQDVLLTRFTAELRPVAGMGDVVDTLTVPVCVASSSSTRRLAHSLDVTGFASQFGDAVFSADLVARGKPAPDLFLHAARVMGVSPKRCIVIEDSTAGIEAAVAAGMTAIGFAGGGHATREGYGHGLTLAGADTVAADAQALAGVLRTVLRE